MFGTEATDKKLAGDFVVLSCGPGTRALYAFKDVLVLLVSAGPGMPVTRLILPAPPRGRVVAGSAQDVSVVTDSGDLWYWRHQSEEWQRVGNPREGGA